MARGTPYRFRRFGRGLNTADSPYNLREGYEDDPSGQGAEAREVSNVVARGRGSVHTRDGCTLISSDTGSAPIKDVWPVESGTGYRAIYSCTDGTLGTITSSTITVFGSSFSTTAIWQWLHLPDIGVAGPYYGMNGVDAPQEITIVAGVPQIAAWVGTNIPNGRFMVYANNRLWVTGVATDPSAVFFSEIGDPTNFPTANITRFDPKGNAENTGLAVVGPYVLVFKERAIYAIYDLDTSANRKITDNAGTISPYSIASASDGTIFLDPEAGVCITDGNSVRRLSEQIQPTLDLVTVADKQAAVGTVARERYYLSLSVSSGARTLLDLDLQVGSWWQHSHTARWITHWDTGTGRQVVASMGSVKALFRLFVPGVTTDQAANGATSAIVSKWSGPFHVFGAASRQKRVRSVSFDGSGSMSIALSPYYTTGNGDLQDTVSFADTAGTAGPRSVTSREILSPGVGNAWGVTITSSSAWEMFSYTVDVSPRTD